VYIIERCRVEAERERDRLAREVFERLVDSKSVRFAAWEGHPGGRIPKEIRVEAAVRPLQTRDFQNPQRSLFDFMPKDWFNSLEEDVAIYFDGQKKLLWWFRNSAKQDYAVQGWKRNKIYPDFIVTEVGAGASDARTDFDRLVVVETKGAHLKNEDTAYKQAVFDFCNRLADSTTPTELGLELEGKRASFHIVHEKDWRPQIDSILKDRPVRARAKTG
jgi:type III restriction enzyme